MNEAQALKEFNLKRRSKAAQKAYLEGYFAGAEWAAHLAEQMDNWTPRDVARLIRAGAEGSKHVMEMVARYEAAKESD